MPVVNAYRPSHFGFTTSFDATDIQWLCTVRVVLRPQVRKKIDLEVAPQRPSRQGSVHK
jgi:hypothetical protein